MNDISQLLFSRFHQLYLIFSSKIIDVSGNHHWLRLEMEKHALTFVPRHCKSYNSVSQVPSSLQKYTASVDEIL